MHTAIIGSRIFSDYNYLVEKLDQYDITKVISGGARGADRLAEVWAVANNIPTLIFEADWIKNGNAAGPMRNKDIIDNVEQVIAFFDGKSPGTTNAIEYAEQLSRPILIVPITAEQQDKNFNWGWDNPLFKQLADSKRPALVIG